MKIKITEQMIDDFAKVSGDFNPIHMDDVYASTTRFKKRICHGMMLASFISRAISEEYVGAIYLSQSLKFLMPCHIGDEIEIALVLEENDSKNMKVRTMVTNDKKLLVDGHAVIRLSI